MSVAFSGPALPPEVWSHVLRESPKSSLVSLLSVCSIFHDIAVRYLFSSIKIYFVGVRRGEVMLNTNHRHWVEEVARKLMIKSWELLNHISEEPSFARVVKSLTVISFADGFSIFERMTLANTLLSIPNLETFRWIGNHPDFGSTVAEYLPTTLRRLEIQASLPLESLNHISRLESVHLSMPWFFPDDEEAHDSWTNDEDLFDLEDPDNLTLESMFQTVGPHITNLRISGSQYGAIPVRIFNCLLDLEIFFLGGEDETVGLDLIFHHATQLQSLTWIGYINRRAYTFLPPSTSTLLPNLTSFRLSGVFDFDDITQNPTDRTDFDCLLHFLQNRKLLRRLYVRLPDLHWPLGLELWAIAKTLDKLEILGLHTGEGQIGEGDLNRILDLLPRQLRALHVAFDCGANNLLPLLDAIASMPNLSFLHLYGTISRLPILLEDLAAENKQLQMIGLNRAIWDIERVGHGIVTNKWPRWKIKFNVEEDFLNEDDAWLFHYN
ncbi:hypothetical protein CPB83DRAFT_852050 [Crepidotus variabilis]|uniref:F-box domain-containing protein n=1 Tax=Crepidotus variabilis TaxID=179855 RepID=A0A9P6EJC3_9AGAR|nr:hypothetical protein CPB83DRAFT_852050 [Crepidotus variabilis]